MVCGDIADDTVTGKGTDTGASISASDTNYRIGTRINGLTWSLLLVDLNLKPWSLILHRPLR
jgi:hypothetical protein